MLAHGAFGRPAGLAIVLIGHNCSVSSGRGLRAEKVQRHLPQLRTIDQIADSIRAAYFLGIYDRFLCADSRHVWQGVADAREDLHDSNTLDGKFAVGMRLD